MNSNLKGILVVGVIGVGVYFAYKKLLPSNKIIVTKRLDSDFGGSHKDFVDSLDKGYVDAWAKAIKQNEETFMYNGSEHWTKGGKTKK
jgi:hypothetical protein